MEYHRAPLSCDIGASASHWLISANHRYIAHSNKWSK